MGSLGQSWMHTVIKIGPLFFSTCMENITYNVLFFVFGGTIYVIVIMIYFRIFSVHAYCI